MDKREVSDKLIAMREQLAVMNEELEAMRIEWDEFFVRSHNLEMENHYLRERLNTLNEAAHTETKASTKSQTEDLGLSKARQNLMHIYEDGFHICNISYGQRRENDEQCMFCLDILYGRNTD